MPLCLQHAELQLQFARLFLSLSSRLGCALPVVYPPPQSLVLVSSDDECSYLQASSTTSYTGTSSPSTPSL